MTDSNSAQDGEQIAHLFADHGVETLVRSWLKTVNDRDAAEAQNNNSPAPPKVTEDQATLTEVE